MCGLCCEHLSALYEYFGYVIVFFHWHLQHVKGWIMVEVPLSGHTAHKAIPWRDVIMIEEPSMDMLIVLLWSMPLACSY